MGHIVRGTAKTNKGNEQTLNGSPQKSEACFAVPQGTSRTRHRLQERVPNFRHLQTRDMPTIQMNAGLQVATSFFFLEHPSYGSRRFNRSRL